MDTFKISDHVEFDAKGRAICPACEAEGKGKKKNLSLVPGLDGAYKCFRGHTPQEIREAIGVPKERQIPQTLAAPAAIPKVQVSPQKVRETNQVLMNSSGPAKAWLHNRGITDGLMERHQLGITRAKVGEKFLPAITVPIPNHEGTAYWQKKRVAPWLNEEQLAQTLGEKNLPAYQPWSQYGVPAKVWFTWLPANAEQTWLCEGEWDAIVMGQLMREADQPIAVASFTCGCGTVPPAGELEKLPGEVIIFYDRNDKPTKKGDRPGEEGAKKVAIALGDRGRIALVPMPKDCQVHGWDVSDALHQGYGLADFQAAAAAATRPEAKSNHTNPLRSRLLWNDELIDSAPEYTEWLVPDLLTTNELFLVAAGPRAGKSLLAMTLALSVAQGSNFLERPVIQGTVLYVCLEDSPAKIKEREQAQGWTRGLPVVWLNRFKLSELPHLREIAEEIDVRLIVIDTLSRAKDATVSESSAEMSQVLEPLQEMASDLDCCILLVHHTGKVNVENLGAVDLFETIRGSSAIRAVCRGSMVIAAGERDYRLVVENGWGKHDLKIVLDTNTLTWRLLGKWVPTAENTTQKELIVEYLRQTQVATVDQLFEATQIPRKSLYEQLARLQAAENVNEKVIKEGSRRNYTYRLALFNTIQQLNSVLNSENSIPDNDRGPIQQKNISVSNSVGEAKSDQSVTSPMCQFDHFSNSTPPPTNTDFVEYPPQTHTEQEKALFNTYSTNEVLLNSDAKSDQTGTHPLCQFRRWNEIDTAVEFHGQRGERAKIRVPGERRCRWVPMSELQPLEDS